jgi:hypothetical protein
LLVSSLYVGSRAAACWCDVYAVTGDRKAQIILPKERAKI